MSPSNKPSGDLNARSLAEAIEHVQAQTGLQRIGIQPLLTEFRRHMDPIKHDLDAEAFSRFLATAFDNYNQSVSASSLPPSNSGDTSPHPLKTGSSLSSLNTMLCDILFEFFDDDNSGRINMVEFSSGMLVLTGARSLGKRDWGKLDSYRCKALFSAMDRDGSGKIYPDEILDYFEAYYRMGSRLLGGMLTDFRVLFGDIRSNECNAIYASIGSLLLRHHARADDAYIKKRIDEIFRYAVTPSIGINQQEFESWSREHPDHMITMSSFSDFIREFGLMDVNIGPETRNQKSVFDELGPEAMKKKTLGAMSRSKLLSGAGGEEGGVTSSDVYLWGRGTENQLGHGAPIDESSPKLLLSLRYKGVIQVACGQSHTLALTSSGSVYAWGKGALGRLGTGSEQHDQLVPKRILFYTGEQPSAAATTTTTTTHNDMLGIETQIKYISAGESHSAALGVEDGHVFTWGTGSDGRLGHGNQSYITTPTLILPDYFMTSHNVSFTGVYHSHHSSMNHPSSTPSSTIPPSRLKSVTCGWSFTAVISYSGDAWSFGSGSYGCLGHCDLSDRRVPKFIDCSRFKAAKSSSRHGNDGVDQIAFGRYHTVVLNKTGEVFTWGYGANGRLGLGSTDDVKIPTQPLILRDMKVVSVGAGPHFSVAVSKAGDVFVWGKGVLRSKLMGSMTGGGDGTLSSSIIHHPSSTPSSTSSSTTLSPSKDLLKHDRDSHIPTHATWVKLPSTIQQERQYMELDIAQSQADALDDGFGVKPSIDVRTISTDVCICQIACNDDQIVALSSVGDVYTWGVVNALIDSVSGRCGRFSELTNESCTLTEMDGLFSKGVTSVSAGGGHVAALCGDKDLISALKAYDDIEESEGKEPPAMLASKLHSSVTVDSSSIVQNSSSTDHPSSNVIGVRSVAESIQRSAIARDIHTPTDASLERELFSSLLNKSKPSSKSSITRGEERACQDPVNATASPNDSIERGEGDPPIIPSPVAHRRTESNVPEEWKGFSSLWSDLPLHRTITTDIPRHQSASYAPESHLSHQRTSYIASLSSITPSSTSSINATSSISSTEIDRINMIAPEVVLSSKRGIAYGSVKVLTPEKYGFYFNSHLYRGEEPSLNEHTLNNVSTSSIIHHPSSTATDALDLPPAVLKELRDLQILYEDDSNQACSASELNVAKDLLLQTKSDQYVMFKWVIDMQKHLSSITMERDLAQCQRDEAIRKSQDLAQAVEDADIRHKKIIGKVNTMRKKAIDNVKAARQEARTIKRGQSDTQSEFERRLADMEDRALDAAIELLMEEIQKMERENYDLKKQIQGERRRRLTGKRQSVDGGGGGGVDGAGASRPSSRGEGVN